MGTAISFPSPPGREQPEGSRTVGLPSAPLCASRRALWSGLPISQGSCAFFWEIQGAWEVGWTRVGCRVGRPRPGGTVAPGRWDSWGGEGHWELGVLGDPWQGRA